MPDPTDFIPFRDRPIDIHCHQAVDAEYLHILSLDTHELWSMQELTGSAYFSVGIHPWFIGQQNIDDAVKALAARADHPRLLAFGECGLDRTVATPMQVQITLFERQLALAEQWRKPVIIHCVRAFNELLAIKKSGLSTVPWIVHGFTNKPQLAEQLLRHGCFLSLGKALLRDEGNAAQTLRNIPLDRLFLETDAAANISIDAIYAAAAKISGLTAEALRQRLFSNFIQVFFP